MDWLWWLGAALLLVAIEVLTLDLVLIMFAGGAIAAGIAGALGAPLSVQIVVLAVVSALLLVAIRPWLLRSLRDRVPLVETNAAAQVGRLAIVVEDVDVHGGRVKLSGEVWSARSAREGLVLPEGEEVRVVRIDGAAAVVDHASVGIPARPDHPVPDPQAGRLAQRFAAHPRLHRPKENA
ncbi:NfeD family protein [uncultured Cellulomonas sp.]|uniref:NfeD family protein n=1 Tax=uncultured Cellulomonas sp. TaxID=189682 RepID=UPI0026160CCD|nr:NfeD family protein [uncultured Cellulomonas sp.]